MQVLAHRRRPGHRFDRLDPQILRVRAGEPDAADAIDRADRSQELGEQRPAFGQVAAVRVDVLPEERDLDHTVGGETLDLAHDLVERARDLLPAHRRHDAERTPVVAPDLDGDPRRVRHLAARRQRGRERVVVVRVGRVEDLSDRAGLPSLGDEGRGSVHVVRPEHDIDVRRPLANQVAVLLGQATGNHDLQIGPRLLHRLEMTQVAVELVVGVLTDAAGVEHDHIGVVEALGRLQPVGLEQTRDPFGVVFVHLAPEGAQQIGAGHFRPG